MRKVKVRHRPLPAIDELLEPHTALGFTFAVAAGLTRADALAIAKLERLSGGHIELATTPSP